MVSEQPPSGDMGRPRMSLRTRMFGWYEFQGNIRAKGYCTNGIARGALVMSNIFLSSALIFLAAEEAGCLNEEKDEIIDDCDERVYGQKPGTLIANIAVFSGLLSAFFMPFFGAAVDYTPYRRRIGSVVAVLMMLIQAAQIGTVSQTWFPMSILQAINGFLYQVQILAVYAYLPEIAKDVGESIMTNFQATFTMVQFASQALFLIVVTGISLAVDFDDVQTGHLGQGVNLVWSGVFFYISWGYMLPSVPPSHELPPETTLFRQSFLEVWRTTKHIWREYKHSLRWFYLALVFAESAVNAFTVLAVTFLDEQIKLSGSEIGIFFFLALIGSLPGSKLGAYITRKTNPSISWRINMLITAAVAIVGAFILEPNRKAIAYAWGVGIGICIGWFYPVENLFFSMLLPKGQEAELAGFYVYCTQLLGWLPPLIFSILVDNDVHQKYGILAVQAFFLVAVLILSLIPSWEAAVEEAHSLDKARYGRHVEKDQSDDPDEEQSLDVMTDLVKPGMEETAIAM